MKNLQEIVRIISRRRIRKIQILNEGSNNHRNSLYYRYYKGIRDSEFSTDEEAARKLLDTDPSNKRYLMLKSRVKDRLLNTLIFLEKSPSRYEQAFYKCNRDYFTAKFLLLNGAREIGLKILRSTLSESIRFSLTDIAVDCLRQLRLYASMSGNNARFKRYNRKLKDYKKTLEIEFLSEEYLQSVLVHIAKTSATKSEFANITLKHAKELNGYRKQYNSHQLSMNYFRLLVLGHQLAFDFESTIKGCDEAEEYLLSHPHLIQKARLGEFALTRMVAYMHLENYDKGRENALKCLSYYQEGSINWMIFLEYYFLLCMHTGNYEEAGDVYQRVVSHPRFGNLEQIRQEKWKIFEAFLRYMLRETSGQQEEAKFNLFKFLNEVPIHSRDKRGMNIAILILQILFLLDRRDFDGIIRRTEALKIYCSRHLRKDEFYRSNCFLKMMVIMEKKDFDWEETERIAQKYFQKLVASRYSYNGNPNDLEIIPYERLWQTILNKLKTAA